ncbi:MAG: D-alanyl-D-alanine carboxypeptidase [Acetobacteraceae bacterium]|nr:D-alanyl-D-alanine carboxypeptidase [Acetobacteraceae bacterium]
MRRLIAAALFAVLATEPARAQVGSDRYASIVVDVGTGRVLSAVNADAPRHPASLTKMMTAYMVFEAVRNRRLTWSTPVVFSAHAAAQSPSKLGLPAGTRLTLEEATLAMITRSANDAAAAIAETLGGTEANFARLMTLRARSLGMTSTTFRNASGLPDPDQITTARDMATLGLRLIQDFPAEYRLFSTTETRVRNLRLYNHNRMLATYEGTDGIKTGFIRSSGFNLVASAVRGGRRLVGVVMGGASAVERDEHMAELFDQAFGSSGVRIAHAGPTLALVPRARAEAPRTEPQRPAAARPPVQPARPAPSHAAWAVQVGAFADREGAQMAARAARRALGSGTVAIEETRLAGRTVWRARVTGVGEEEARRFCAQRARARQECALIAPAAAAAPPAGARRTVDATPAAAAPRG